MVGLTSHLHYISEAGIEEEGGGGRASMVERWADVMDASVMLVVGGTRWYMEPWREGRVWFLKPMVHDERKKKIIIIIISLGSKIESDSMFVKVTNISFYLISSLFLAIDKKFKR